MLSEEVSIKLAKFLEELELKVRTGEVLSVFISVNYGKQSCNVVAGNREDMEVSLAQIFDEREFCEVLEGALSRAVKMKLNNLKQEDNE